jgi:phage-related protein
MSSAQMDLELLIRANADAFSKELSRIDASLEKLKKRQEKTQKGLSEMFTALTIGAAGAILGIVQLSRKMGEWSALANVQAAAEKQVEQAVLSTGMAAGLTADEIKKMASSLQDVTTVGDEAILSGQSMLLTFTNIGKDVFPRTTETMLNMATAMSGGITPSADQLKSTAIQLGKALNDPRAGISALSKVGVQLTDVQKESIEKFMEQGDIASAQTVILEELETQFGGLARAMADTPEGKLIQLNNTFGDLKEILGGAVNDIIQTLLPIVKKLLEVFEQLLPILLPIIEQLVDDLVPVVESLANNIGTLLKPLGRLINTLLQGLQPILGVVLGLINRLIPLVVNIIKAVEGWVKAMEPLIKVIMKIMIDQMDQFIPLLNSLISIMVSLTPLIKLMAEVLADVLGAIAWANEGLMDGFLDNLEEMASFVDLVVQGLVKMGLLEKTVSQSTREFGDANYEATQKLIGTAGGFDMVADAAREQGIMVATTAGAYNLLSEATDKNTKTTDKNTGAKGKGVKAINHQNAVIQSQIDLLRAQIEVESDIFERHLQKVELLEKERELKLRILSEELAAGKINQEIYNNRSLVISIWYQKEIDALTNFEAEVNARLARIFSEIPTIDVGENPFVAQLEDDARKMQPIMDMISNGFSVVGQAIGESLVGIGESAEILKNSLKAMLLILVDGLQKKILVANADLAIEGVLNPLTLIYKAPLAAAAYAALEIAKGAVQSFDVGALQIPQTQLAMVHQNEMIIPATFAEALRKGQISLGGASQAPANRNIKVDMRVTEFDALSRYESYKLDRMRM